MRHALHAQLDLTLLENLCDSLIIQTHLVREVEIYPFAMQILSDLLEGIPGGQTVVTNTPMTFSEVIEHFSSSLT